MTLVGLDVGTSAVKGVAVDPDGRVRARAAREYPSGNPHPGWSEQEPEQWWRAAESVLDELQVAAGRPAAVGLSGQMHGLVALDAADRPVRPAILWNDQRAAAEVQEIDRAVGCDRLVALTGNRAVAGFTAPKLLWMRRHEPERFGRIAHVLLPKDYVRLRLCGERATDVSDASGTLLFDVGARAWSDEMSALLGVPGQWLPAALESAQCSGTTPDGVPVAAGAGDQAAGAVGVGVLAPGPASIVLGTSGVVFAPLAAYRPEPLGRTHTFCHAAPGLWHAMGVMLSAAGSLAWLRDVVAPGTTFADLVAEAGAWGPGVEGLTFLPYLAGERTPHADPEARGAFTGLSLRHDRGALVRAVLEGVAFGLRDCLDVVRACGAEVSCGIASGGGAASDLWLRILAGVLELPVARTRAPDGAAFGAALLAGVCAGEFGSVGEAIAATVATGPAIDPDPAWSARYDELHTAFTGLYPALHRAQPPHNELREIT